MNNCNWFIASPIVIALASFDYYLLLVRKTNYFYILLVNYF